MKHFVNIFLIMILSLSIISCDKENSNPDNNNPPDDNPTGEIIPPDDDPVTATIDGVINEAEFDENLATSVVTVNRIPHSLDKFLELQDLISHTLQGAAVMMLVAIRIYQQYPIEGKKCLTAAAMYPLIKPATTEAGAYEGYIIGNVSELTRKLEDYEHLPFVYYQGASPSNGYEPDAPPYSVNFKVTKWSYISDSSGDRIKVFINSEAADSPRPVTAKKVDGVYKVTEYSSLYLAPKPIVQ